MRGNRRRRVFQAKTMLSLQSLRNGIAMRSMLAQTGRGMAHRVSVLARAVVMVARMVVVMVALGAIVQQGVRGERV